MYVYPTTPPTIYESTFEMYVNDMATLHVQEGCKAVYEKAIYWKYFLNILEDIDNANTATKNTMYDINNTQVEYYDLRGRRVVKPTSGIYIVKQGETVRKVLINEQ